MRSLKVLYPLQRAAPYIALILELVRSDTGTPNGDGAGCQFGAGIQPILLRAGIFESVTNARRHRDPCPDSSLQKGANFIHSLSSFGDGGADKDF